VLKAVPFEMVAQIKSPEEMGYWELEGFINAASRRGEPVQKYQGQLEFKKALPWMNFIVILLGIALTARAGRKGSAVLFGIGLGLGVSKLLSAKMNWPTLTSPSSIVIAFFFSAAVGISAGLLPALKASRLDVIDALRYE